MKNLNIKLALFAVLSVGSIQTGEVVRGKYWNPINSNKQRANATRSNLVIPSLHFIGQSHDATDPNNPAEKGKIQEFDVEKTIAKLNDPKLVRAAGQGGLSHFTIDKTAEGKYLFCIYNNVNGDFSYPYFDGHPVYSKKVVDSNKNRTCYELQLTGSPIKK